MNLSTHCQLCDHQLVDFQTGTKCGLTNKTPHFNVTCPKIRLREKFENKLRETNIYYHVQKRQKPKELIKFIGMVFIGLAIMAGGYYFGEYAMGRLVNSGSHAFKIPLIIMGIGFLIIPKASYPFITFNQELKALKQKKEDLDAVLELYHIDYDFDITFGTEHHFTQDIDVQLNVRGVR